MKLFTLLANGTSKSITYSTNNRHFFKGAICTTNIERKFEVPCFNVTDHCFNFKDKSPSNRAEMVIKLSLNTLIILILIQAGLPCKPTWHRIVTDFS